MLTAEDFKQAKILIAIPHSNDMVPIDFCKSLMALEKSDHTKVMWLGHTITSAARNILAQYAIRNRFDYVFFLDADMSLPKEAMKLLFMHDLDIVSGMYMYRRGNDAYIGHFWDEEKDMFMAVPRFDTTRKLNRIEAHGCGCLLIKTSVFGQLPKPWFYYNDGDPVNREYVEQASCDDANAIDNDDDSGITMDMYLNSGYNFGEDFNFFKKVREAGISVYVDTTILCGHISVYSKGPTQIIEHKPFEKIEI